MEIKRKRIILTIFCLFFVLCAALLFCACSPRGEQPSADPGFQEEIPQNPSEEDEPDMPENPDEDENPGDVENPGEVEKPGESEKPGDDENPGGSEDPGEIEDPGEVENPSEVDKPGESEKPGEDDENLGGSEKPGEDENLGESEKPGDDENPGDDETQNPPESDKPTGPDKPAEEDPLPEEQPEIIYEKEETISLANNGIGFVLEPFLDGDFSFIVENEEVATALPYFESAITLYPVSVGETKLTVKISTEEKIWIKVYNIIVLPFDENLNIEIEGLEENELKGGTRADGSYLLYNASVVSCRNLATEDFFIEKSDNIIIVENSIVSSKTENGGTKLSFSFYVLGGQEANIKVYFENNFANLLAPTEAQETFVVSEFLKEISYELTNEGNSPIKGENGFKLYLPTIGFEDEMDGDGYFTYYNLTIDKALFSVSTMSSNIEIIENEEGFVICSKEEGTALVVISANDGSNLTENFIIETAPLLATEYVVSMGGEETIFTPEDFCYYLLGLESFEMSKDGDPFVLQILQNPIYSKTEYQIVVASGSSVKLIYEPVGGVAKLSFVPVEKGKTDFNILYNGKTISSFTVEVKEKEYEILIENIEDENEIKVGSFIELNLSLTHYGAEIIRAQFEIICNQSGVIFDNFAYNGTVFIEFQKPGDFYFTITASDYGVSRTIKFIVV